MVAMERIVILDYSTGEVYISSIPHNEDGEAFIQKKGLDPSQTEWIRGDLKIYIENEIQSKIYQND